MTTITGVVRSFDAGEPIAHATVSLYTLAPVVGLVGRTRTDPGGAYRIDWPNQWTMARDLYVVILDRMGQLLQVIGDGRHYLSGDCTARDYLVRRRRRRPST
jgi:hypothetical protein